MCYMKQCKPAGILLIVDTSVWIKLLSAKRSPLHGTSGIKLTTTFILLVY